MTFTILFLHFLFCFSYDCEDKHKKKLVTLLYHISKQLKVRQKYCAARRIFCGLLNVCLEVYI